MIVTAMGIQCKRIVRLALVSLLACLLLAVYIFQQSNNTGDLSDNIPAAARQHRSGSAVDADRSIDAVERHCRQFDAGGHMFNEFGRSVAVSGLVSTCLIHSFSPYIEREAAKRFLDPARDNIYFANSPAITWHNDQLVLVSRVWLDRERYEAKKDWPANHFADNWLYTQRFDRHMRPLTSGQIIGIPAPKQWWVGDGPIEPRLVSCGGHIFVTFNAAMAFSGQHYQGYMDYTVLWDLDTNLPVMPYIEGGSPMVNATEENDMPRDKHWMAFVEPDDQLHFVHNLDPLRVMSCSLDGQCRFVQRDEQTTQSDDPEAGFIFRDTFSHLRGGTPFEIYRWPYYVSVAHTTMYKSANYHRYYTAHLVVLCVRPTYRVVYVSGSLRVSSRIYRTAPMVRPRYIDDGFIFPVGLIVEDADRLAVGVHVNDHSSVILRLKGVKALMDHVIRLDRRNSAGSQRGPPVGYLQQYIRNQVGNETHISLIHQH